MKDYGRTMVGPLIMTSTAKGEIDARYYGDTYNYSVLVKAIEDIGSDNRILYLSADKWSISSELTIPRNITLRFEKGAYIEITNQNLIINGYIEAYPAKIFSFVGTGGAIIKGNDIYPEWWGAIGDEVFDDTIAMKLVFNNLAHNALKLNQTYKITDTLTVGSESNWKIIGNGYSRLTQSTPNIPIIKFTKTGINNWDINNINLGYTTPQTNSNSLGIMFSHDSQAASTSQYYGKIGGVVFTNCYDGVGIDQSINKGLSLDNVKFIDLSFIDCKHSLVNLTSPVAQEMYNISFDNIKSTNDNVIPIGDAIKLDGIKAKLNNIDIKNWVDRVFNFTGESNVIANHISIRNYTMMTDYQNLIGCSGSAKYLFENLEVDFDDIEITNAGYIFSVDASQCEVNGLTLKNNSNFTGAGKIAICGSRTFIPTRFLLSGLSAENNNTSVFTNWFPGEPTFQIAKFLDRLRGPGIDKGDADCSIDSLNDPELILYATPLTADRVITLNNTWAFNGAEFKIIRTLTSTGSFNLKINDYNGITLKSVPVGSWCEVDFDVNINNFRVTGFGTL
jgi:hypothetical protein